MGFVACKMHLMCYINAEIFISEVLCEHNMREIFLYVFKKMCGSVQTGPATDHRSEWLHKIKVMEFCKKLSSCWLLRKDTGAWSF
jgi:hypothetical protein